MVLCEQTNDRAASAEALRQVSLSSLAFSRLCRWVVLSVLCSEYLSIRKRKCQNMQDRERFEPMAWPCTAQ